MLTDMHFHLQDIKELPIRASIMKFAQDFKAGQFVCNGTRPDDWPVVEEVARSDRRVVPFFGVHPWYADKLPADWHMTLEGFLKRRPDSGIGEAGLDKARHVDFARQTEIFHRQRMKSGSTPTVTGAFGLVVAHHALLYLIGDLKLISR